MAEQICPACGKTNSEVDLYCFACGELLPAGQKAIATHSLEGETEQERQLRWGTAYFGDDTVLMIQISDAHELIEKSFRETCVLGRAVDDTVPDVDLTAYTAADLGVSRRHAKLTRQCATIMVQDLGSLNGTFLNGVRLNPYQPRVLRNGDQLCLGRLCLRISYKAVPKPKPT